MRSGPTALQGMSTPCALRRGAPVGRATPAGAPPASMSKRAARLPPLGSPAPSSAMGARPPLLRAAPAAPMKGLARTPLVGMCEGGRPLQQEGVDEAGLDGVLQARCGQRSHPTLPTQPDLHGQIDVPIASLSSSSAFHPTACCPPELVANCDLDIARGGLPPGVPAAAASVRRKLGRGAALLHTAAACALESPACPAAVAAGGARHVLWTRNDENPTAALCLHLGHAALREAGTAMIFLSLGIV